MIKLESITILVKKVSNDLMEYIRKEKQVPGILPSERILSNKLSVSRSTLAKVFKVLENKGIIKKDETSKIIIREPNSDDLFQLDDDAISKSEFVKQFILNKLANYEYKSGTYFSELELSKESGVNTVTVREVLLKISKTGLIKKEPRQRWKVVSLTKKMVKEITTFRKILETSALNDILSQDKNDSVIQRFTQIRGEHLKILRQQQVDYDKFIKLEKTMHNAIIEFTDNRYIKSTYESIFTIVHYHIGQPGVNKIETKQTIKEHINLLNEIINWDKNKALEALSYHLEQATKFILKISDNISINES